MIELSKEAKELTNEQLLEQMGEDVDRFRRVAELLSFNQTAVATIAKQRGATNTDPKTVANIVKLMCAVLTDFADDLEEAVDAAKKGSVDVTFAIVRDKSKTTH